VESRSKWKRSKNWIFNKAKRRGNEIDGTFNIKIKKRYSAWRDASRLAEGFSRVEGNQQVRYNNIIWITKYLAKYGLINKWNDTLRRIINNISVFETLIIFRLSL
jgi:hypothetical protein